MAHESSPAVFQLVDTTAPDVAPEVLGLWVTVPAAPGGVAFDAMPAPAVAAPVWRVALPPDPRLAAASLSGAEATLDVAQVALAEAVDRLAAFAGASAGDAAFGLPAGGAGTGRPEAELTALLREAQAGDEVVFDAGEQVGGRWEQVSRQFQIVLDRLAQAVAHYAWVETYAGDRRVGWTVVGWTGDVETLWRQGLGPEQVALHQRALVLALASRATLLRMVVLAARGAMTLSMAAATPLGPILALPAAWTFIDAVLAEVRVRRSSHDQLC